MIRHIVAIDQKRGIAKQGVQPWKLPSDERYFAEMTKSNGGIILMGRKTFEAIGRPLPGRQNFVATHDTNFGAEGVTIVHDINEFLNIHPEVWIIGGGQIYSDTLARADELYITQIDADFGCDTFYPSFVHSFCLADETPWQMENGLRYRYTRFTPAP